MELSDLIKLLELQPNKDRIVKEGFENPHSYRGDYECLGLEPAENVTLKEMIKVCKETVGKTLCGWKGGDYYMDEWTRVYFSYEGATSGEPFSECTLAKMLGEVVLPDGGRLIYKKE